MEVRLLVVSKAFDLFRELIKGATWVGLAFCGVQAIALLAGQKTEASLMVGYFTSSGNDFGLPWVVAIVSMVYGYIERRLRLRKTEYFQGRVRELEELIDAKRTSSGLLPNGQTHPEDRVL